MKQFTDSMWLQSNTKLFFKKKKKRNPTVHMETQRNLNSQSNAKNKGILISNVKIHYNVVLKNKKQTYWYWHKNRRQNIGTKD